jgi:hypothetical protein
MAPLLGIILNPSLKKISKLFFQLKNLGDFVHLFIATPSTIRKGKNSATNFLERNNPKRNNPECKNPEFREAVLPLPQLS